MVVEETTIYVYLLNEATDVWRPVQAEILGNQLFRIISENLAGEDECWQFSSGTTVRCETKVLSDGAVLAAVEAM